MRTSSSPNETSLPTERDEASATTSSAGKLRSARVVRISRPTLPVAPTTATLKPMLASPRGSKSGVKLAADLRRRRCFTSEPLIAARVFPQRRLISNDLWRILAASISLRIATRAPARCTMPGPGGAVVLLGRAAATRDWRWLAAAPIVGYAPAWFGHAVFEHNRPGNLRPPALVAGQRFPYARHCSLTGRLGRRDWRRAGAGGRDMTIVPLIEDERARARGARRLRRHHARPATPTGSTISGRRWPTTRRPCAAPGRASRRSWRRARSTR